MASENTSNYEFVEGLPDRYTCSICLDIQNKPVLVSCCGKHFCGNCLEGWIKKNSKKCPQCRRPFTHIVNKQQERDINELKVYCSNRGRGCDWIGELQALKDHISYSGKPSGLFLLWFKRVQTTIEVPDDHKGKCDYQKIHCPNDQCLASMQRNKLQEHMRNECEERPYQCQHCGRQNRYKRIIQHYETCLQFPIECPNKCSTSMKRKELQQHRETCPLEPVKCSFSEIGCDVPLVRKDLENHLATSDHHHLVLTMTALVACRKEVAQLKEAKK